MEKYYTIDMGILDKYKKELMDKGEVYLRVKVSPRSVKDEIQSIMDDETVKLSVKAIAEKGKANESVIKLLAKELSVQKKNVKIISGGASRIKLIKIVL